MPFWTGYPPPPTPPGAKTAYKHSGMNGLWTIWMAKRGDLEDLRVKMSKQRDLGSNKSKYGASRASRLLQSDRRSIDWANIPSLLGGSKTHLQLRVALSPV
jgi:hypothetical protein